MLEMPEMPKLPEIPERLERFAQDFHRYAPWSDRSQLFLLAQTESTNRVAWEALQAFQAKLDRVVSTETSTEISSEALPETLPGNLAETFAEIIVIAEQQTAGRGQWGRSWQSAPGGLYLSLGIVPTQTIPTDRLPLCPLFTALGVAQALQAHQIPVGLKWPNDLRLETYKLGGILVETRAGQSRLGTAIVIGIGVNWQNDPPHPGIALQAYQKAHNLETIDSLAHLAAIVWGGLKSGYAAFADSHTPLTDFIHRYDSQLADRGSWIAVGADRGQIAGITATGALRVLVKGVEQEFRPGTLQLGWPGFRSPLPPRGV